LPRGIEAARSPGEIPAHNTMYDLLKYQNCDSDTANPLTPGRSDAIFTPTETTGRRYRPAAI